jgi:hypothetical protein
MMETVAPGAKRKKTVVQAREEKAMAETKYRVPVADC